MAKLIFLGTGTSDGIPQIGCKCSVCKSKDKKDKRLRTSILIKTGDGNIVIDSGIDFRQQALQNNIKSIEAVLFTHYHTDHIEGITELRPLSRFLGKTIPCMGNKKTIREIKKRFNYIFSPLQKGGGLPQIKLSKIKNDIVIFNKKIIPLPVKHGILPILGFRFGNLAYITDASLIPESTMEKLNNLDILIINALRPHPHPTHFSFDEAVSIAKNICAKKTYFIHMNHAVSHKQFLKMLPVNMKPAYDGLELDFSW